MDIFQKPAMNIPIPKAHHEYIYVFLRRCLIPPRPCAQRQQLHWLLYVLVTTSSVRAASFVGCLGSGGYIVCVCLDIF